MSPAWYAASSIAFVTAIACVLPEPFHCEQDDDCISSAGMGWCEATSFCSYAEQRCASKRRYSDLAGPFAGECVVPADDGSSITVADDTASDESTSDELDDTASDDAGESGDEPLPTDAHVVWSRLVAHPASGSDRFLAVLLSDDRIVAAGQQIGDVAFVAVDPGSGDVLASLLHNVGGTDDAVHAFVRGDDGELVACGRNDDVVLGRSAWIGSVDTALAGPPLIASFWSDHACRVVTELDADRMIVAGDGVPIVPGSDYAWLYAFDRGNPTIGTMHSNEGQDSRWNAATHVDGEVLFGGRLGTGAQTGKGVVAALDAGDAPSEFPVFSDALWTALALAPDATGFVLGGFESPDGAPAAWVSAHTKTGSERWSWRPGHDEWPTSQIEDVAVDSQGFVLAVGSVSDGSDQQRWIVRLDLQGVPSWSYALPNEMTGGHDIASAVMILPDDDIVVVGEAEVAPGETDAWVARFSVFDE